MYKSRSFEELIFKIDAFIKLYYRNLVVRGVIYSVALLLVFFLAISFLEYFSYFGKHTRTALFFGYIGGAAAIVYIYIFNPLFKLFKIGKRISYQQAAGIISVHFPEISDKLLNTLQLGEQISADNKEIDLIEAAIEQKTSKIKNLPFAKAIDKRQNLRRTPYAVVPVIILLVLLFASPGLIKEPSIRLANFNIEYVRPAPFRFVIDTDELNVLSGSDLNLSITVEGNGLPSEVFVEYDRKASRAVKAEGNKFVYRFRNLQNDLEFRLQGAGIQSEIYRIKVYPRPRIIAYSIVLEYPDYIRRPGEELINTGDFSVPEGTNIAWRFNTEHADSVLLRVGDDLIALRKNSKENYFTGSVTAKETFGYSVKPVNMHSTTEDSLIHRVTVVPDRFPEIQLKTIIDSTDFRKAYFTGQIRDDYGFNKLEFHYKRSNIASPAIIVEDKTKPIPIDRNVRNQSFFYSIDFNDMQIQPGDKIEYWFEVWDNDAVNGSKSTRSGAGTVEMPGVREREKQIAEKQEDLTSGMSFIQKALFDLSREIEQLQRSILQKESISWEDTNKLQEMLERQMQLQTRIDNFKEQHEDINRLQEEIRPISEDIIRKQQELQKLFDELMTDEMRKLFEELQKLVDEMDRSKMQEMLNKMQMSNEELLQNLDRNLELFKKLQVEKMLTDAIAKLEKLAEEQNKLTEETAEGNSNVDDLSKKQEEILEEFRNISDELESIKEKNDELEWKYDMIDTQKLEDEIKDAMENSLDKLNKDQKPGSIPHQRDATKGLNEMSENLMSMMAEMQNQQLGEDIRMLRKLLEDLLDISFDQEDLIDRTASTNRIDPNFNQLLSEQKRLVISLKQVEDSLTALAKRQLAIQSFVLKEISLINTNVEEALKTLEERNIRTATTRQQYVMTSVNNLALMLSEALDQMMSEMMSSSMDGESCPAPGLGKSRPNVKSMKDLQQQLNQQMQQMKQSMGKPDNNGEAQPGGQSMSEQFARMAAQQEALRRQMQQYLEELRSETGKTDANALRAIEEMEQTEKDLVHKRMTNETLLRQERILSRLLESERAELEREIEERRESRSADNYEISNPDSVMEFYRKKLLEREMLRTVPPRVNSFYRSKINDYFIQVQ